MCAEARHLQRPSNIICSYFQYIYSCVFTQKCKHDKNNKLSLTANASTNYRSVCAKRSPSMSQLCLSAAGDLCIVMLMVSLFVFHLGCLIILDVHTLAE